MNKLINCLMAGLVLVLLGCDPDNPVDPGGTTEDSNIGTVEFDFPVPARNAPTSGVHRIDLSLATTAYDLYRGDFLISANVSDRERTYTFRLTPGDYYYQAGITCSCLGDTCLWDGFPGGRFGTKWDMDRITVVKGEKLAKTIVFN
ncbi:MAG: hypothetical protein PHD25_12415 [Bacteroidales bacterium]|nr:hypothetical protein [Bacteroidales bacterium]